MKQPSQNSPIILAIETSGLCGSVALVTEHTTLAEYSLNTSTTHSKKILVVIDQMMTTTGLDMEAIDGIAVSLGPGSFTGLRIGLSTAKGFAMATGKPLLGIPTLDAMAAQFSFTPQLICPVLDARKKEVYAALYRSDKTGKIEKISDDMVLSPEALAEKINEPVLLVGDGAKQYKELFLEKLEGNALFPAGELFFPRGSSIGMLALQSFQQNKVDPARAEPIYVRKSDAELSLGKRSTDFL
ncbi:MAG: tRNA (adenosine(37)-N6)-threonylcarbamoyltransferase complex dimerization subunit type 1 TsaB [Proteobacteria bacterium]|nr:tRNA (adenosine(37)-N6)-threonylcarbamoyltransferase complex dimerization subunit type 1 TsaB [Pseudomonadota bacterium]MBU1710935.1 tRNA (adenosine(37)-N6)-threonylcarbamoyltransferase complex dimerization subunit type 1 TsaB [Pseudomonadota bacterium]